MIGLGPLFLYEKEGIFLSVDTAERITQFTEWQTAEYALSLNRLRKVGEFALASVINGFNIEGQVAQLRAEFDTSLAEMLKSDQEHGANQEITRYETYKVCQDDVLAHDGTSSIIGMLENGFKFSSLLSEQDNRMLTQANRDKQDLLNAKEVVAMVNQNRSYNTRVVVSLLPEEAVARDGEEYWKNLGYFPKTKTAFLQMYHATPNGDLLTGTLSLDFADKKSMGRLWSQLGCDVPADESTDNWLGYALTGTMTKDDAVKFVQDIRNDHNKLIGHTPKNMTSIEQVLDDNVDIVNRSFNDLHLSLADTLVQSQLTDNLRYLLNRFLSLGNKIDESFRTGISNVLKNTYITNEDARLIYKLIMYTTVEMIRESQVKSSITPDYGPRPDYVQYIKNKITVDEFLNNAVNTALKGVEEKRSYGACGTKFNFSSDNESAKNPQLEFGGKSEKSEEDKYGSLKFQCKKGHWNKRPRNKLIPKCKTCGDNVKC